MALQSPEMRELYDLKVFVVSFAARNNSAGRQADHGAELRFGPYARPSYNAGYP